MRKIALSTISYVSAGQGAPKQNEFSDSGIPFVRAGSLEDLLSGKNEADLELVPTETAKKRKLKLYPKGSILFAKSGMSATKDRIYVLQNSAYVVSHLAILTPKDNINTEYLRFALKKFPPSVLIKDLSYPAIGLGEIQDYEIPVPEEHDDQKRIAHLLGKVEGLIARRKKHLQQLDDLLKSVFLEMFGSFINADGASTLNDCLKIQQGFAFKSEEFIESGIPIIKIGTVNKGFFDYSTLSYIAAGYPEKVRRYEIKPGDLLISLTGTVGKDDYGNTCFVPVDSIYPLYLLNQRVGKLICDSDTANPHFIDAFLKLPKVKTALIKQNRGVRQANLSNSDIYSIKLSIPPIDLQNQFATIVEKVEGLKSHYQQSLNDLERLYGALSQKAFKGELDLSRVPLPSEGPDLAEEENIELKGKQFIETLFEFPAPKDFSTLRSPEGKKDLFAQWLPLWFQHLGNRSFSAESFLDAAYQRLDDLIQSSSFQYDKQGFGYDEAEWYQEQPKWDIKEYRQIKTWIFDALKSGFLTQSYNETENRVQITVAKDDAG